MWYEVLCNRSYSSRWSSFTFEWCCCNTPDELDRLRRTINFGRRKFIFPLTTHVCKCSQSWFCKDSLLPLFLCYPVCLSSVTVSRGRPIWCYQYIFDLVKLNFLPDFLIMTHHWYSSSLHLACSPLIHTLRKLIKCLLLLFIPILGICFEQF